MNTVQENQKVANSQGESMAANEGATTMVAGVNNNNTNSNNSNVMVNSEVNGNSLNSNEMDSKVINSEEKTIDQLRQEVEDAKKAVEENADGSKTKQKAREVSLRKAVKAVKTWFEKQTMPKSPVQFWRTESEEQNALMIAKEDAEIIIAVSDYNLQIKPVAINMAVHCLNDKHFELDAPKYITPAELLYNAGMKLKDLNGNTIPENTPNVYVPVGGADEHALFYAAHKLNIDAKVNNTPKIVLRNICVKTFDSMQEVGKYIGNNTVLDRALSGSEQAATAALATGDELMQRVHKVTTEKKMPKSTVYKYYSQGARLTSKQWKEATCGILPEDIKYDLTVGETIINVLNSKGFESIIGSRYLIDAIAKFANLTIVGNTEPNGIELTLQLIQQLTANEVGSIINTKGDKDDMLFNWLSRQQGITSQQAA